MQERYRADTGTADALATLDPMHALSIALIVGASVCAVGAVYWAIAIVRIVRELAQLPRVREGLEIVEPAGGWPRVSVIVPAHNEEALAPRCAESLLASDHPSLEVIFVLDRCTDRTLERLTPIADRDPRLRIIENRSCPPDWAGKCNAARVGAEHAGGEALLFTDADTEFDPRLVRAATALLKHRGLSLVSLLPTLTREHFFERAAQPVASLTLLRMYPISSANRPVNPRVFANGQFLLFDRAMYERLGGHTAVKDDLLEDIAFARAVRDRGGGRCGLFVAESMLVVRMYDSMKAFSEGWKRIFIEACLRHPGRLRRKAVEVMAIGVGIPIAQVLTAVLATVAFGLSSSTNTLAALAWLLAVGGFVLQTGALAVCYRQAAAPLLGVLFHPFGSWIVAASLWGGALDLERRRPVRWGGREYVLEPR